MKPYLTILLAFIGSFIFSQNLDSTLIQLSLNNQVLQNHYLEQNIFEKDRQLTYQIDDKQDVSYSFLFGNYSVQKYDTLDLKNREVNSCNFHLKKVNVNQEKVKIIYEFYPFWGTCENESQNLQYSNGIFFTVETNLIFNNKIWEVESSLVIDIKFEEWMEYVGLKCIIDNYKPLK